MGIFQWTEGCLSQVHFFLDAPIFIVSGGGFPAGPDEPFGLSGQCGRIHQEWEIRSQELDRILQ